MKIDFSSQNGKRFDQMIQPAKPSFWDRWKHVMLMATLGLIGIVVGSFAHNREVGEHISKIGTYVLAGAITIWILRFSR